MAGGVSREIAIATVDAARQNVPDGGRVLQAA
jgi:hypothetical protein